MPRFGQQTVLNFHGLGEPLRQLERGEAPYWISVDFFEEIIAESAALAEVRISFDDGNLSDLSIATPILLKHGLQAKFFILAGRLDMKGSLARRDVLELDRLGMDIGNHGFHHVDWRNLNREGQTREWVEARNIISDVAGKDILGAAIPFGAYNRTVLDGLREQKYQNIYSSDGGRADLDNFLIPRTSIRNDMDIEDIRNILRDSQSPLKKTKRKIGMLRRRWFK